MVNEITDPKATYLVKKIIINQEKIVTKNIFFISIVTASMDIKRITPSIVATPLPPLNFNHGENICPKTTEEPSIDIASPKPM